MFITFSHLGKKIKTLYVTLRFHLTLVILAVIKKPDEASGEIAQLLRIPILSGGPGLDPSTDSSSSGSKALCWPLHVPSIYVVQKHTYT